MATFNFSRVVVSLGHSHWHCPSERMAIVLEAVCHVFHLHPSVITGRTRPDAVVWARHIAMILAVEHCELTHLETGRMLGGRDGSTVSYALRSVHDSISTSEKHKASYEAALACLQGLEGTI